MNLTVDLNADLGEGAGHDEELLTLVTSANIACGFHAGDADTMHECISEARDHGVAVGAHPSLFDRENFGRKEFPVTPDQVFEAVTYQLGIFQAIASDLGVRPNHIKPHGALYNMATRDEKIAKQIARAILAVDSSLILFAPDNSALAQAGRAVKLRVACEVFAEARAFGRRYGIIGPLARAISFEAGMHLSVCDFEGAEALQREAREMAASMPGGSSARRMG